MSGSQNRSGKAGWLFADVAIALAFVFLATAAGVERDEGPPPEDPVTESEAPPVPDDPDPHCDATVDRYGDDQGSEPLIAYTHGSDPLGATEALRAWRQAHGIDGVDPAFVQVFGVSPSGSAGYEVGLAEAFRDEVLAGILPDDVIVDAYQGTTSSQDGVRLLWYVARC